MKPGTSLKVPDGGWGWLIVLSNFLFNLIADGMKYSFGVLFIELTNTFQSGKGETSFAMSLQVGFTLFIGPLSGALTNRFGCRKVALLGSVMAFIGFVISPWATSIYYMYASFGVVAGVGFGLMAVPLTASVVRYFDKKLAFASGLACMGSGVGTIVFTPLSRILIDTYTWRGALLIESGMVFNAVLCAALLRSVNNSRRSLRKRCDKRDEEVGNEAVSLTLLPGCEKDTLGSQSVSHIDSSEQPPSIGCNTLQVEMEQTGFINYAVKSTPGASSEDNSEKRPRRCNKGRWIRLSPLKDVSFLLYMLSMFLLELGVNTPFAFLPHLMVLAGFQRQDAVLMVLVIGVSSTASRVITGWIGDRPWSNRVAMCTAAIFLTAIATALCPFCYNLATFTVFSIVFGLATGCHSCLRPVLLPDLFGKTLIADYLGLLLFASGIACFTGLPIAGKRRSIGSSIN